MASAPLLRWLLVLSAGVGGHGLSSPRPRVSIIGGGVSPSLRHLTAEAAAALAAADVVVYDSLGPSADALAALVPPQCELVPVGKRGGDGPGAPRQRRIDELLVDCARRRPGDRVVRLKGGDPFVFGRARGECDALRAAGVPFEVLPGVSSTLAAPLLAGIPRADAAATTWQLRCRGSDAPA